MNNYSLPTSLEIEGTQYRIRTDYRDIINIIIALGDPDLDNEAKAYVFFTALFIDPVPPSHQEAAIRAGFEFINAGNKDSNTPSPKLMDWEQDANLIIPAVNKVAGEEVRSLEYLHWWTFVGYYMEIGESQFSSVVNIRQKLKKHQKLEKYEQEYYRSNKATIDLKAKISTEEMDALNDLVGWSDK